MEKQEVKEIMQSSKSEQEWNENCDKIKEQNNGQYPDFWFETIILSGVLTKTKEENNWSK
mgnify:CR=1 FL=1